MADLGSPLRSLRPHSPTLDQRPGGKGAYAARALLSLLAVSALLLYFASPAGGMLSWPGVGVSLLSFAPLLAHALTEGNFLLARYAVQSFATAVTVVSADYLLGAGLLRLLPRSARAYNAPLRAAVALSIGAGLGGMTIFFLGELHRLKGPLVWGGAIIAAGLGALILTNRRAWKWAFSFLNFLPRKYWWALALFLPALMLHAMDLLTPVAAFDSTTYHMAAARFYKETSSLRYDDALRYNAQPHLPVLIYLRYWLLLGDDSLAKIANLELGLIVCFLLIAESRMCRVLIGALIAFFFVGSSPNFWWVTKIEYMDLALTAFFSGGVLLLYDNLRRNRPARMVLPSVLLGLAGACKFLGLVFVAFALGIYLTIVWTSNRPRWSLLSHIARTATLMIVLTGAPWWIRSWMNTGSPVYPFFSSLGSADAAQTLAQGTALGLGRSLQVFALMAFHLTVMRPFQFSDSYSLGPALLLLELAALVVVVRTRLKLRLNAGETFLAATVVACFLFWFLTGQVQRYLVPLLPIMAFLFLLLLQALGYRQAQPRVIAAALIVLAVHAAVLASTVRSTGLPPPVRYSDKDAYLMSALPYYKAVEHLNREAKPEQRKYLLAAEAAHYYVNGPAYGDWFGQYSFFWLASGVTSEEAMIRKLKGAGFEFILVDRVEAARNFLVIRRNGPLPFTESLYSDGRYSVLRIQ